MILSKLENQADIIKSLIIRYDSQGQIPNESKYVYPGQQNICLQSHLNLWKPTLCLKLTPWFTTGVREDVKGFHWSSHIGSNKCSMTSDKSSAFHHRYEQNTQDDTENNETSIPYSYGNSMFSGSHHEHSLNSWNDNNSKEKALKIVRHLTGQLQALL